MTSEYARRSAPDFELYGLSGPHASSAREAENHHANDEHDTTSSNDDCVANTDDIFKYVVLVAASLILFVGVGYTNTYGVFEEYYQTHLFPDEVPSKLILIGSVAASLYLILGVFMGRFADLMGYRTSMLIGSGLMIGSMFAASVSKTYIHLFLSQGVMFGLGVAFIYLPAVTISRQYWSARRHGLTNGIVVSGGALGGLVLPYVCRVLIDSRGLPETFRVLGYLAAALLGPCCFLMKPKVSTVPLWKKSRNGDGTRPPLMDLSLLKDDRFNALLLSGTIAMIGFLPRYFLIPPSAIAHGISTTYASWLLGLMNGLSIVGRVGIGWIADRYGKVNALSASFILCGLGHFIFWLPGVTVPGDQEATTTAMFTLFSVYTGIFGSGFVSLFPVVVSHLFGSNALASKVGLLNTVVGVGTLAGPSAVYAIIGEGVRKHWSIGVLSAGMFMFIGGLLMAASLQLLNKKHATRED